MGRAETLARVIKAAVPASQFPGREALAAASHRAVATAELPLADKAAMRAAWRKAAAAAVSCKAAVAATSVRLVPAAALVRLVPAAALVRLVLAAASAPVVLREALVVLLPAVKAGKGAKW